VPASLYSTFHFQAASIVQRPPTIFSSKIHTLFSQLLTCAAVSHDHVSNAVSVHFLRYIARLLDLTIASFCRGGLTCALVGLTWELVGVGVGSCGLVLPRFVSLCRTFSSLDHRVCLVVSDRSPHPRCSSRTVCAAC